MTNKIKTMKQEESKKIIDNFKENPTINFEKITLLISKMEDIKNKLSNKNEVDSLTDVIKTYEEMIKVAPMLKSTLTPNLELLNKTLHNLKNN
jgi:uncharacterized protein YneF (UPF0154 family)